MIELFQITNDPDFARRCDALDGVRVFVDLERLGKAERQAGRNTFISVHQMDDVARVKAVLKRARLMVRVNPMNPDSAAEVQAVLARGADLLMLPMFTGGEELRAFSALVAGRAPLVALLETASALATLDDWIFLLVVIVGGFLISRRLHDSFQHRVEEFTTAQAAATRHE